MTRWIWVVVALVAMSCSGPEKPEGWRIERQADDTASRSTICDDVEAIALGELAEQRQLEPVLDELSRLAAVLGASAALPAFDAIRTDGAATGETGVDRSLELLTAATALDAAAWAECGVPVFTAMYAAAGWPYCHGELDVPVTLYLAAPDPTVRTCTSEGIPPFLPCWEVTDDGYLPVDCLTEAIVTAANGDWVDAGTPRTTTTTTTTTTLAPPTSTAPPVIEQIERPECAAMADLFTGDDPLRGDSTDLERILDSTTLLGSFIIELASDFEQASEDASPLEVIEQIVIALDSATTDECGIPVISGAYHFVGGVDKLPCWSPTGNPYPSYAPTACS